MSKGKPFEEAVKILDDQNVVQNLRKDVSLAMKNDDQILKEFRWTNRTDLKAHFDSLTGIRQDPITLKLELSDGDVQKLKEWIQKDERKRPDKFKSQTGATEQFDNQTMTPTLSHVVAWETVVDILKDDITGLDNKEIKDRMEKYLNDPGNERLKQFVLNEMRGTRGDMDLARHNSLKDELILRQSIVWNPNIVVAGPSGSLRKFDPDHGGELKKYTKEFKDTVRDLLPKDDPQSNDILKYEDKIDELYSDKIKDILSDNKASINKIAEVLTNGNENKASKINDDLKHGLAKISKISLYKELNQKVKELKSAKKSKEENLQEMQKITADFINKINVTVDETRLKDIIFKIDSELVLKNQRDLINSLGQRRKINILKELCNMDERKRGTLIWKKDDKDIFKRYIFKEG